MKKNTAWKKFIQSAKEGLKPEWKDLIWIATAIVTCLIAIPIITDMKIAEIKEAEMAHNRALLAPGTQTSPIMDLAGNALDGNGDGVGGDDFVYRFTVEEATPTPAPFCTPVACPAGELVCPSGNCPGGCGMVCALDITPTAPVIPPDLICVYYTDNPGIPSYCYNNPKP